MLKMGLLETNVEHLESKEYKFHLIVMPKEVDPNNGFLFPKHVNVNRSDFVYLNITAGAVGYRKFNHALEVVELDLRFNGVATPLNIPIESIYGLAIIDDHSLVGMVKLEGTWGTVRVRTEKPEKKEPWPIKGKPNLKLV